MSCALVVIRSSAETIGRVVMQGARRQTAGTFFPGQVFAQPVRFDYPAAIHAVHHFQSSPCHRSAPDPE
jgi:hypothetical protein